MNQRHHNHGLRKVCVCPRRAWAKCAHPWHFNYKVRGGPSYRFSLDAELGRHIASKTEAQNEADRIRSAIRAGTFRRRSDVAPAPSVAVVPDTITLEQFGEKWFERRGKVVTPNDKAHLKRMTTFTMDLPAGPERLGGKALNTVTTDDLEAFFLDLKKDRKAAATLNKYRLFIAGMFKWAAKKGYVTRNPLAESETITHQSERGARRNRRLAPDVLKKDGTLATPGEERRLLAAAGPALQRLIIASLETGLRLGELLNLRWQDVSFQRGDLTVQAATSKTRTLRTLPISQRLRGVLDMLRTDPNGADFKPTDYVFNDGVGGKVGSIKKTWTTCVLKAHGHTPKWEAGGRLSAETRAHLKTINLHWHDLRHEAGSRFIEAGWPVHHVQAMLGHADLKQTSTYLNITRLGLHDSMRRFSTSSAPVAIPLQETPPQSIRSVATADTRSTGKSLVN